MLLSKRKNDEKRKANVSPKRFKIVRLLLVSFIICGGVVAVILWNKPWINPEYPTANLFYSVDNKLYSLNFQTQTSTQVSDNVPLYNAPRLSPDGQWFISWQAAGSEDTWNLMLQRANSNESAQNLGQFLGAKGAIRWSSDSQQVAFSASADITTPDFPPYLEQELWVTNIKTGAYRRITYGSGYQVNPCFSPNGDQIAYSGHGYAGGFQIYILDLTTGESRHLNYDSENLVGDPTWWPSASTPVWSPDGKWIAFTTHQSYVDGSGTTHEIGGVWIIHPDGTGAKQVRNFRSVYIDWGL